MLKHRVVYSAATVAARVDELARVIHRDVPDSALLVIGLLTGSFVLVADLVRALARLGLAPLVDFMAVSHYGAATATEGALRILKEPALDARGRPVLLVDDILDSGATLRLAREHLATRGPRWLRTCVLLDKPSRRVVDIQADYVGFEVPDVWLIGYGLDLGGQGRALPYIAAVAREDDAPKEKGGR